MKHPSTGSHRTSASTLAAMTIGFLAAPLMHPAAAQGLPAVETQYPFVCTTAQNGLGQPLVDNQARQGIPVAAEDPAGVYPSDERGYPTPDARIVGWSRDCEVDVQYGYLYKATGGDWRVAESLAAIPDAGVATTRTTEGHEVPFVVHLERGTVDRFIYSVAMLAPVGEASPRQPDTSLWNRRLLFSLQGGVAIGHTQGSWSQSAALYEPALQQGYAVINSTGLRTNSHYNLIRGGRTAVMLKEHFVENYGEPLYTVAVGGSGGAIQQYVYQQNHPDLLDGGVPQYAYPDMITQTIHTGDCELLEHYFERTAAANPRWRDVTERTKVVGLNAEQRPVISDGARRQFNQLYEAYSAAGLPTPDGWNRDDVVPMTECRPGWYGLTPLSMNPTFTNVRGIEQMAGGVPDVKWTHWDDAKDVYGVDADGWARQTWDNVGVQYGLEAVRGGGISPDEFLHLNAYIGGWKHASEMVPEGCPIRGDLCDVPEQFDPWSARQMNLSPGGDQPAPRTEGDAVGIRNAWANGHVFRGHLNIPVIEWRHYLEHQLDMHNTQQSFASRQRIAEEMGDHERQLVWFTDARPGQPQVDHTPEALAVLHDWITNIKANPAAGIAGNKPASATDRCWNTDGTLIAEGDGVWAGVLDDRSPGECTRAFPLYSTSRRVAGAPYSGDVFKCATMPVRAAVARGLYGSWRPTEQQIVRLEQIFPTGVCDYTQPPLGQPVP
ncbi:MAG: DUF6351 family protein [Gemmatimonadota bacterium]